MLEQRRLGIFSTASLPASHIFSTTNQIQFFIRLVLYHG